MQHLADPYVFAGRGSQVLAGHQSEERLLHHQTKLREEIEAKRQAEIAISVSNTTIPPPIAIDNGYRRTQNQYSQVLDLTTFYLLWCYADIVFKEWEAKGTIETEMETLLAQARNEGEGQAQNEGEGEQNPELCAPWAPEASKSLGLQPSALP
ncbi:hypothetical protein F5Y10DRAFT_272884 [Nemania abortiva]|nr:hypothetical protein F5Y10DRAFT_272884 [Nemania abortiva]